MTRTIPLSVPSIEGNAWKYVKDCLDTNWVSSVGRYVGEFERAAERFTGARHAVAGVNGSACLHLSLQLCGAGPGDAVLVPALTFLATANAVSYTGATAVFLDCEPGRFNLDLDRLEGFLETRCAKSRAGLTLRGSGLHVKAVVPVHVLGFPVDMDRLMKIARRWGLSVVEDAAESIGSYWNGRHTGTFGKAGVLSFNGNKIITTGGGGMILSNDDAFAKRAKHMTQQAKAGEHEYVHDAVGYNYRLTNVLAAIGLSQMEILPDFLRRRERLSSWYAEELGGLAPIEPVQRKAVWNRWLLSVQTDSSARRDKLLRACERAGVQARPLWMPCPMQAPYRGNPKDECRAARRAYDTVVSIPSSTSLTRADVARVARVIRAEGAARLLI